MVHRRYALLGWVVWRGARWYARRRLAGARRVALAVAVVGGVVGAGVALARARDEG